MVDSYKSNCQSLGNFSHIRKHLPIRLAANLLHHPKLLVVAIPQKLDCAVVTRKSVSAHSGDGLGRRVLVAGSGQVCVLVEECKVEASESLAAILGLCLEVADIIGIGECAAVILGAAF